LSAEGLSKTNLIEDFDSDFKGEYAFSKQLDRYVMLGNRMWKYCW